MSGGGQRSTPDGRLRLHVGGTVDPRQHIYIERPQDEELFQALRDREYCNVMTSRQMGKSSAYRYAALRLMNQGIAVADIDIGGNLGSSHIELSQWYVGFLRHICDRLCLSLEPGRWWDERPERPASQRLQEFFREQLLPAVGKPLVLFLDEADVCLKLPFTGDFFVAIRAMYNQRVEVPAYREITFCLLGVAQPHELIRHERTTPYNIGKNIHLRDFDRDADDLSPLVALLDSHGGAGADKLDAIFAWTDGHPYLTTSLCQKSLDEKCRTVAEIEALLESTYHHVDVVRRQDTHFAAITRFLDVRGGLETIDLYRRILDGARVEDDIDETRARLKLSGIVKADETGTLVVRNRIYKQVFDRAWVRETQPRKGVRRLWSAVIAASLLVLALGSWVAWDRLVREPRARRAAERAEIRRAAINGWLTTLGETESEATAAHAFALLAGQATDDALGAPVVGYQGQARALYEAFWQRRAAALEGLARARVSSRVDEGLILAARAALQGDRAITAEPFQKVYDERRYRHLIATLRGHDSAVNAAAYTPDGRALITVSDDGRVIGWNPRTGRMTDRHVAATLGGKPVPLASLSVARVEGQGVAVTVANEGFIGLWNIADRGERGYALEQRANFYVDPNEYGPTYHAVLHPDGELLLTAGESARLWDIRDGRLTLRRQAGEDVFFAVFSPDVRHVATASMRGVVDIWPASLRGAARSLRHGADTGVLRAVFDDQGNLATAALDGHARLWLRDSGWRTFLEYAHTRPVLDADHPVVTAVSVCGRDAEHARLVSAARADSGDASVVVVWHRQGHALRTLPSDVAVYDVDVSPDCGHVAVSDASGLVRIFAADEAHDPPVPGTPRERWHDWQARLGLTADGTGTVTALAGEAPRQAAGLADMKEQTP